MRLRWLSTRAKRVEGRVYISEARPFLVILPDVPDDQVRVTEDKEVQNWESSTMRKN